MKRFRLKIYMAVAAVCGTVFWPGCEKVSTDLDYNVIPYLQLPDVDTLIHYTRYVKVFYHEKDTAEWWVASYEDAAQGRVTNKITGDTDTYIDEGFLNDEGTAIIVGPLQRGPVMLVAFDTQGHGKYGSRMYAWRQISIEPGIQMVRIPVIFDPEKRGDTVQLRNPNSERWENSRWEVANDNPWLGDEEDDNDQG